MVSRRFCDFCDTMLSDNDKRASRFECKFKHATLKIDSGNLGDICAKCAVMAMAKELGIGVLTIENSVEVVVRRDYDGAGSDETEPHLVSPRTMPQLPPGQDVRGRLVLEQQDG